LGPSASNKQPWRIFRDREKNRFHVFLQRTPGYVGNFGDISLQNVDMGIAMCHFELSARELGLEGHWQVVEVPIKIGNMSYIASWTV
jgi:hypothetical protein